ncbi:MAG: pilus assembly protein [Peptococcaceae bacterium]|nr:pilus assembly protein [Peptococcaceae bacterium]
MLEFAGCIVIIVLLYLVIITLGLRVEDLSAINKAARDGGRQTAITSSLIDGENKAKETAWAWGLDPGKFEVRISKSTYGSKNIVTCETYYRSSPFAALFPTITGNTPVDEKELYARSVFGWWDLEN